MLGTLVGQLVDVLVGLLHLRDQAALGVMTNYGALNLYLNFINMFQFLLSFMGNRR